MRENGSESDSSAENSKNWIPPAARAFHERNAREKSEAKVKGKGKGLSTFNWIVIGLWIALIVGCTVSICGCSVSQGSAKGGVTDNRSEFSNSTGQQATAIPKQTVAPQPSLAPQPTAIRRPVRSVSEPRGKEGLTCTEQAYILSAPGLFGEGAVSDEQLIKAANNDLTARDCAGYW